MVENVESFADVDETHTAVDGSSAERSSPISPRLQRSTIEVVPAGGTVDPWMTVPEGSAVMELAGFVPTHAAGMRAKFATAPAPSWMVCSRIADDAASPSGSGLEKVAEYEYVTVSPERTTPLFTPLSLPGSVSFASNRAEPVETAFPSHPLGSLASARFATHAGASSALRVSGVPGTATNGVVVATELCPPRAKSLSALAASAV